jgi:nucleotide-binding universal stress UspA family protein
MPYKTVLVLLGRSWSAPQVKLAFSIAQSMDAHLIALWAGQPMAFPAYKLAEAGPAAKRLNQHLAEDFAREERSARERFDAAAARWGHTKCEWRVARGEALPAVALSARYADLVIAAQPVPGIDYTGHEEAAQEMLAIATGRPVLHVPCAGRFPSCGKSVLVAWNATREAARAVTDSLPILQRAEQVRVLVVDPGVEQGEMPGADLGLYLARHGVKVEVTTRSSGGIGIGEVILSTAAEASADLIVMGAYGHSRIREFILGGATRTLLESMTVPVLMAH